MQLDELTALVLLGISHSGGPNALPAGAVLLGLGGITFHLSQFHISNLFPRNRGLISSLFVAGFTGCGVIFYFLDLIFGAAGGTRCARACVCAWRGMCVRGSCVRMARA